MLARIVARIGFVSDDSSIMTIKNLAEIVLTECEAAGMLPPPTERQYGRLYSAESFNKWELES